MEEIFLVDYLIVRKRLRRLTNSNKESIPETIFCQSCRTILAIEMLHSSIAQKLQI